MGKYPQNRFRRLVVVDPADNQKRSSPAVPRWGLQHPNQKNQTRQATREQFKALRMAVMPTLSRGIWLEAATGIVNFVRSYFVTRPKRRGAVVLSFRRSGFRRPWGDEPFVTKKASGSVCWNRDREAAPQEGGRG